jgi:hypothetical protein
MSDRFRYRYWDEFNRVMIYSHYHHNGILSCFFAEFEKAEDKENNPALMQCAEKRAHDGILIFEGDVVVFDDGYGRSKPHVVEWNNGFTNCSEYDTGGATTAYPYVIGNIYEHPELVEG